MRFLTFLNIGNFFSATKFSELRLDETFRKPVSLSDGEGLCRGRAEIMRGRQSVKLELPLTGVTDAASTRRVQTQLARTLLWPECVSPPPPKKAALLKP